MATISSPESLADVSGIFGIFGSVSIPDGGAYRIAIQPAWSGEYHLYLALESTLDRELLGLINAEIFGIGLHRLRLTVVDSSGEMVDGGLCDIPLVFSSP